MIKSSNCSQCNKPLDFEFSMAFQPIVDISQQEIFAYEALVRGINNEPAAFILDKLNDENRYHFDQASRSKAIQLASQLNMQTNLSINFLPGAVYNPEMCIRSTLEAAERFNFSKQQIMFEVTEGEKIENHEHLNNIIKTYQELGFKTAIDDFGAGYSGLNLLAEFQPDMLKLDMALIRDIDKNIPRQAIVRGIIEVANSLSCKVIAEGIETEAELKTLRDFGIRYFQGYLFSRPMFEELTTPILSKYQL